MMISHTKWWRYMNCYWMKIQSKIFIIFLVCLFRLKVDNAGYCWRFQWLSLQSYLQNLPGSWWIRVPSRLREMSGYNTESLTADHYEIVFWECDNSRTLKACICRFHRRIFTTNVAAAIKGYFFVPTELSIIY